MSKKTPLIVYWSPYGDPRLIARSTLIDLRPRSLMADMQKRRVTTEVKIRDYVPHALPGKYQTCAALHTITQNKYTLNAPFSAKVELDENGVIDKTKPFSGWFRERVTSMEDAFCIDFDYLQLFFCDEKLDVTLTPAYMHRTSYQNQGYLCAAKFDISSWFRSFPIIYQLWQGERIFTIDEGEPLAYITFETDRKIIFKQFEPNQKILDYVDACQEFKFVKPFQSMQSLYERFHRTRLRDMISKEIKANLVD